jgi:hypothetical protein
VLLAATARPSGLILFCDVDAFLLVEAVVSRWWSGEVNCGVETSEKPSI